MSSLVDIQRDFQGYLTGTGSAQSLAAHIAPHGSGDDNTRMQVYFDAYRLRLIEALQTDFSTLFAATGEEQFNLIAERYITAHPSNHPSIRWFGKHLGAFLRDNEPWREYRVIGDTAALDWAISLSLDAGDAAPLEESDLAAIAPAAWPNLRFGFHPSMRTLDTTWNIGPLRLAADAGEALPEPERFEYPVRWLVWRQDLRALFRSLEVDEAYAVQAVRDSATFGEICEGLCEWIAAEHVALRAAGFLRQWVMEGLVVCASTN
ncbi:MAG: hypothetical protein GKR94_12960 [Gammaproteobacteria bacterium]|nr:hypothetical protein [Gammaproteobacteria bacterium]